MKARDQMVWLLTCVTFLHQPLIIVFGFETENVLTQFVWRMLVMDEAHRIKVSDLVLCFVKNDF